MRTGNEALERIIRCIDYDPTTGSFYRKVLINGDWIRPDNAAPFGTKTIAGLKLTVSNVSVLGHRLAYRIVRGHWYNGKLRHSNGDNCDNRWINIDPIPRLKRTDLQSAKRRIADHAMKVAMISNGLAKLGIQTEYDPSTSYLKLKV